MTNEYDLKSGASGSYNSRIDEKFIAEAEKSLLDPPNEEYTPLEDFIAEMEMRKKN
jgi:hypothetical protein